MFREGDIVKIISKEHYPTSKADVQIGDIYQVRLVDSVSLKRVLVGNWFVHVNDVKLITDIMPLLRL